MAQKTTSRPTTLTRAAQSYARQGRDSPEVPNKKGYRRPNPPDWLPDWQDLSRYPDPKTAPMRRWAWEFLRRNEEYQRDAGPILASNRMHDARLHRALAEGKVDDAHTLWDRMKELGADETETDDSIRRTAELARKWALSRGTIPDPANDRAWNEDEFEIEGSSCHAYPARWAFTTGKPCQFMARPKNPNEIAVVLDLSRPLQSQFESVRRLLSRLQDKYVKWGYVEPSRIRGRSRNPALLLNYLRAFDAAARGYRANDVVGVLYPDCHNEYPDRAASKQFHEHVEAAKSLIEGDYRWLKIEYRPPRRK